MATENSSAQCIEKVSHSRIKVEEKSRSAVFINLERKSIRKIKVDGCLVNHSLISDWIVSKDKCLDVIVELKGRDVDHAIEQVLATLKFWETHQERSENSKLAALIVCNQYPRIDTRIQRAKQKLAKEFEAPLHIKTRNEEYSFCALARFTELSR